jgi:hypothetical protein
VLCVAADPTATTVSGVYGVLMLLLGAAATQWLPTLRRHAGAGDEIA